MSMADSFYVEVTFAEWTAASPAQRFVRIREGEPDVYLAIPDEIYHSETYQLELIQAIREQAKINAEQPLLLDGVLVSDPTEEHSWPTYGGITRAGTLTNTQFNQWLDHPQPSIPLTLDNLNAMFARVPYTPPPLPRKCNEATFRALLERLSPNRPSQPVLNYAQTFGLSFAGVTITIDNSVPDGEFVIDTGRIVAEAEAAAKLDSLAGSLPTKLDDAEQP